MPSARFPSTPRSIRSETLREPGACASSPRRAGPPRSRSAHGPARCRVVAERILHRAALLVGLGGDLGADALQCQRIAFQEPHRQPARVDFFVPDAAPVPPPGGVSAAIAALHLLRILDAAARCTAFRAAAARIAAFNSGTPWPVAADDGADRDSRRPASAGASSSIPFSAATFDHVEGDYGRDPHFQQLAGQIGDSARGSRRRRFVDDSDRPRGRRRSRARSPRSS